MTIYGAECLTLFKISNYAFKPLAYVCKKKLNATNNEYMMDLLNFGLVDLKQHITAIFNKYKVGGYTEIWLDYRC